MSKHPWANIRGVWQSSPVLASSVTSTAAASEIITNLLLYLSSHAPLRWGQLTDLHVENLVLDLKRHLYSGLWWSTRLSSPHGFAAARPTDPQLWMVSILWGPLAGWSQVTGIFLPWVGYFYLTLLESAAVRALPEQGQICGCVFLCWPGCPLIHEFSFLQRGGGRDRLQPCRSPEWHILPNRSWQSQPGYSSPSYVLVDEAQEYSAL